VGEGCKEELALGGCRDGKGSGEGLPGHTFLCSRRAWRCLLSVPSEEEIFRGAICIVNHKHHSHSAPLDDQKMQTRAQGSDVILNLCVLFWPHRVSLG
jgi:hypothetical protein